MSAQTGRMRRSLWQERAPMSPSPGKAARWEVSAAGPPLRTGGRSRLPPPLSTFTTSPTPPLVAIPVNTTQAPTLPFTFMSQVSNGCISVSTRVLFPFTDPSPHGLAAGKYFTAYQVLVDDANINQMFETPRSFQERQRLVLPCRPAAPDIRVSFIKSPPPPAGSQVNPGWPHQPGTLLFCRTCNSPSTPTWASFPRQHPSTTMGSTLAPLRGKGGLRNKWFRSTSHVSFHSIFISFVRYSLVL